MRTGWTGGQYSIYRVLLAAVTLRLFVSRADAFSALGSGGAILILGFAAAACVALALGYRERPVSAGLFAAVASILALADGAPLVLPGLDVVLGLVLLALHLGVVQANAARPEPALAPGKAAGVAAVAEPSPNAPFGSWDARGRPDPAGDWQFPVWTTHAAWLGLVVVGLVSAMAPLIGTTFRPPAIDVNGLGWVALGIEGLAVVGLFRPRARARIWIALGLWHFAFRMAFGPALVPTHLWLFHALAFDPGWLPGRRMKGPTAPQRGPGDAGEGAKADANGDTREEAGGLPRLFYDGECGLCHRSVRILLSEEGTSEDARALRFAPLGGDSFQEWAKGQSGLDLDALPDSIVLACEDGRVLTRSSAAIDLASRLGGFWRVLALAGNRIPEALRDGLYDGIAGVRKSIFAKPKDACPILPPPLRKRFDL